MSGPEKPIYRQRPFSREARSLESATSDDRFDRYAYETNAFLLKEVDESTWRVYIGHEEGSAYVDISPGLGKFIRNAITAQERAHAGTYLGHDVPDSFWYQGYLDFPPEPDEDADDRSVEGYDNQEWDDDERVEDPRSGSERDDTDEEFVRPAVSEVLRRLNCHLAVLHALSLPSLTPPGSRVFPSGEQYDEVEDAYRMQYFPVKVGIPARDEGAASASGERRFLENSLRDIERGIESLGQQWPIVGRISTGPLGEQRVLQHSFVILGRAESGEYLCFEKMHRGSPPFRISTLRDIAASYGKGYQNTHVQWDFIAGDDLVQKLAGSI